MSDIDRDIQNIAPPLVYRTSVLPSAPHLVLNSFQLNTVFVCSNINKDDALLKIFNTRILVGLGVIRSD